MSTFGIDRSGSSLDATVGEGYFSLVRLVDNAGAGDSATHITLQAPDISASYTLTFPVDDGTANQLLSTDGSGGLSWVSASSLTGLDWDTVWTDAVHTHQSDAEGGTIDHGLALTGLTDDDHTQYALLAGRSGGQTLIGGTASGDDLTLNSTSDATKGDVFFQTGGGNVIVGGGATASRLRLLEPSGSGTNYTEFVAQAQAGDITYTLPAADGSANNQLQTNGSGTLSWATRGLTLGTEQASTSGTAISFTGIPAGTTMVVVTLEGVSTNGTHVYVIQIGPSGGVETTGYVGVRGSADGIGSAAASITAGFDGGISTVGTFAEATIILTLKDSTNNTWSGLSISSNDTPQLYFYAGTKSIAGALSTLTVTATSATFDAGSINIAYF